jgi:alanyl-tRNA synthetase
VGAGVRRIEALTGRGALEFTQDLMRERRSLAAVLRVGPEDVERRIRSVLDEIDTLHQRVKQDASQKAKDEAVDAVAQAEEIGGVKFVTVAVDAPDAAALRKYGDELRDKLGLGLGLLCQNKPHKPIVLVVASDRLIKEKSITAVDLTNRIAQTLSYRGGGKPHMAQVGLPDMNAFRRVRDFVRTELENTA